MRPPFFAALVSALILVAVSSCALPQWRVFQTTVPKEDANTPPATKESQKRAAKYIAVRTAPPVPNAGQTLADVHEVAVSLSSSLGEPAKAVTVADQAAVIAELSAGLKAKDNQLEKWQAFGRKYGGKPLEETGINLAGPAGLLGLVAVVALCIAVPPIGFALLRWLPILWGYFRKSTAAISEFARANPDAGEKLAVTLGDKFDSAQKRLVKVRAKLHRIPRIPTGTTAAPFPSTP